MLRNVRSSISRLAYLVLAGAVVSFPLTGWLGLCAAASVVWLAKQFVRSETKKSDTRRKQARRHCCPPRD